MKTLRWFIAGALAVPLFHQVLLYVLNASGWVPRQPFEMTPTEPFGVPQLISLAFWGGVWGVLLGMVVARTKSTAAYWIVAGVFGAIAPTLVAVLLVAPLKGQPIAFDAKMLAVGLLINGVWGLGTAALYRAAGATWQRSASSV